MKWSFQAEGELNDSTFQHGIDMLAQTWSHCLLMLTQLASTGQFCCRAGGTCAATNQTQDAPTGAGEPEVAGRPAEDGGPSAGP
jgi:hypothetical protein